MVSNDEETIGSFVKYIFNCQCTSTCALALLFCSTAIRMKKIIAILLLILSSSIDAQNLVNNPSFEDLSYDCKFWMVNKRYIGSDTILANNFATYYWNNAYYNRNGAITLGSYCYLYNCVDATYRIEPIPLPYNGNSYVLISNLIKNGYAADERTYAQNMLKQSLVKGKQYKVSFWVLRANLNTGFRDAATDAMGVYITKERPLNNPDSASVNDSLKLLISATPQIQNTKGNFLEDTTNWQQICGYFTAQGGERWLTIGNFSNANATNIKYINDTTGVEDRIFSNYYIDMVSLEIAEPQILPSSKFKYICDTLNVVDSISAIVGASKYIWNTGDTTATIKINRVGKYWVTAEYECGKVIDTAYVKYMSPKTINLGTDIIKCADNIPIKLNADSGFYNYKWNTGETTQNIQTQNAGTYIVNATYECGEVSDTIQVTLNNIPDKPVVSDITYCLLDTARPLTANGYNLQWYNNFNDTVGNTIAPIPPTTNESQQDYFVTQTINSCISAKAKISVNIISKPFFDIGNDTVICIDDKIAIGVQNANYRYVWNDSLTIGWREINNQGKYILNASNTCGNYQDSIYIGFKKCDYCVSFPNAFSPNNDGINDFFYPHLQCEITNFYLAIYNRWGNKIFESYSPNDKWNGKVSGYYTESDTYVYYCTFNEQSKIKSIKGNVFLLK